MCSDKIASMIREVHRRRRTLVVLFVLCLTIFAQTSALRESFEWHDDTGHCCVLCHAGSLPFLETTSGAALAPAVTVEGLVAHPEPEGLREVLLKSNSSRAPPSPG